MGIKRVKPSVQTRQEMAQFLNDRMLKTYESLRSKHELEPSTSLVKTYFIEAHIKEKAKQTKVFELLSKAFNAKTSPRTKGEVCKTKDSALHCVYTSYKNEPLTLFVDTSNTRFWLVHSANRSIALDWLIDRLVNWNPWLDRAWFPPILLENIANLGRFRGLSLNYDHRYIPDIDFDTPSAPVEFLKMQLWGNRAADVLKLLRRDNAFPHETTLSKVKIKYILPDDDSDLFSIDEIKFNGKLTARGNSFLAHITLASQIYRNYIDLIRKLEHSYFLGWKHSNKQLTLHGCPINILFKKPINDLDIFCDKLFNCSIPFKLWGIPRKVNDSFYIVQGVDLHSSSIMDFEVTQEYIRLYLPHDSCGNSVIRLYTNLQHYYDAKVTISDSNDRPIFN